MRHRTQLCSAAVVVVVVAVAASPPSPTHAQQQMWVGFHDDPVLRYGPNRQAELGLVRTSGATVVRTVVDWSVVAPTRPRRPADPFSADYRFADLDELVRNAQLHGLEVLMTVWGTPRWANGGRPPRYLPRKLSDFSTFARALATRYSGRFGGYPFVRFFGIWNESNLGNFLSPQYDARGRPVSPKLYAGLAAAGYAAIRSGSPHAQVAIGETSSHGRDRRKPGFTDTMAPAMFARLVAQASPRLRFDAWAQHPYPVPVSQPPTQKVRYPNVALSTLPRFEHDLDRWFGRKGVRVWVTEYGTETKPGEPRGVTEPVQARYLAQAATILRRDARVDLFIWFVFRDSHGSTWQSGVYRKNGTAKPSRATWSANARVVDEVNGRVAVRAGTKSPTIRVHTRELCATVPVGGLVSVLAGTYATGTLKQLSLAAGRLAVDCTVPVKLTGLRVAKGKAYRTSVDFNVGSILRVRRSLQVVGI
jgi:hypothetical protein